MQGLIGAVLRELFKFLDIETVKDLVDGLLDRLEDKVAASPNKFDDAIVPPLIGKIRELLHIDDKSYGIDKD